ncbi:Zn(2)-C7 fungal-type transcription factor [Pseudohyphozyma bogoriensis]|nr:Zn(2)-C7 fungal-type transcription factor [Pseudohyphozyma bogoriensis]
MRRVKCERPRGSTICFSCTDKGITCVPMEKKYGTSRSGKRIEAAKALFGSTGDEGPPSKRFASASTPSALPTRETSPRSTGSSSEGGSPPNSLNPSSLINRIDHIEVQGAVTASLMDFYLNFNQSRNVIIDFTGFRTAFENSGRRIDAMEPQLQVVSYVVMALSARTSLADYGMAREAACRSLLDQALAMADYHGTLRTPKLEAIAALQVLETISDPTSKNGSSTLSPIYNAHIRQMLHSGTLFNNERTPATKAIAGNMMGWTAYLRDAIVASRFGFTPFFSDEDLELLRNGDQPALPIPEAVKCKTGDPILDHWVLFNAFIQSHAELARQAQKKLTGLFARRKPYLDEEFCDYFINECLVACNAIPALVERGATFAHQRKPFSWYVAGSLRNMRNTWIGHCYLVHRVVGQRLATKFSPSAVDPKWPRMACPEGEDPQYWRRLLVLKERTSHLSYLATRHMAQMFGDALKAGLAVGSPEALDGRGVQVLFSNIEHWLPMFLDTPVAEEGGPPDFDFSMKEEELGYIHQSVCSLGWSFTSLAKKEAWVRSELTKLQERRAAYWAAMVTTLPPPGFKDETGIEGVTEAVLQAALKVGAGDHAPSFVIGTDFVAPSDLNMSLSVARKDERRLSDSTGGDGLSDSEVAAFVATTETGVKKLRSCSACRVRRVKCERPEGSSSCYNCINKDIACVQMPKKKRKPVVVSRSGKRIEQAKAMFGRNAEKEGQVPILALAVAEPSAESSDIPVASTSQVSMPVDSPPHSLNPSSLENKLDSIELQGAVSASLMDFYLNFSQSRNILIDVTGFREAFEQSGRRLGEMEPQCQVLGYVVLALSARSSDHPALVGSSAPRVWELCHLSTMGKNLSQYGAVREPACRTLLDQHGTMRKPSLEAIAAMQVLETIVDEDLELLRNGSSEPIPLWQAIGFDSGNSITDYRILLASFMEHIASLSRKTSQNLTGRTTILSLKMKGELTLHFTRWSSVVPPMLSVGCRTLVMLQRRYETFDAGGLASADVLRAGLALGSSEALDNRNVQMIFSCVEEWLPVFLDMPTAEEGGAADFDLDRKIDELGWIHKSICSIGWNWPALGTSEPWVRSELEKLRVKQTAFSALTVPTLTLLDPGVALEPAVTLPTVDPSMTLPTFDVGVGNGDIDIGGITDAALQETLAMADIEQTPLMDPGNFITSFTAGSEAPAVPLYEGSVDDLLAPWDLSSGGNV